MSQLDVRQKLAILADAAKYDASCASSGTKKRDSADGRGIGSTEGMGICHSCVCTMHEGMAEDLNTGERSSEPNTALRICVSRACTDLSLDL